MSSRLRFFFGSLMVVAPLLSGCGSGPGAMQVRWVIGAGNECDDAGIDTVRITLRDGDEATVGPFSAECEAAESGPLLLDDIEAGSYVIVIEGLNAQGEVIYTGESAVMYNVSEDKTTRTDAVTLTPAPARIRIAWRFEDGHDCAFHAVARLEAKAFEEDFLRASEATECGSPEALMLDELPPGNYVVQVNGLDENGDVLFRYMAEDVEVSTGEETLVDEMLEDCATRTGGCP